jgi:hypothetical protein
VSISVDDIIQSNTGTVNSTAVTMTLASGTTAGNTVLICVMTFGSGQPTATIDGFVRDHGSTVHTAKAYILRKSNVAAGETSWSLTGFGSAQPTVWFALEVQGLHRTALVETFTTYLGSTGVTSTPTNTTPQSTIYEGLAFAIHGGQNISSASIPAWSAQTNGFVEFAENSRVDGATATSAAVSVRPVDDIGTFQCTATSSQTVTSGGVVLVLSAAGSTRQPNPDVMCGFEIGTTAGLATGNAAAPPVDVVAGTPAIVSTSPRSGTYCLELAATAAAESVAWTSTGALSLYTAPTGLTTRQQYVMRVSFYFPTALPGADVTVCAMDQGTGITNSGVQVVYRTASQKIGVQVSRTTTGAGTEQLSATTVAANTWYHLDVYLDMANEAQTSLWWADWELDGVPQTRATRSTPGSFDIDAITQVRLGWLTATTATIRYDDFVGSKHPGHFPLGDIGIYPLKVDPAGTVTVTTAAAFSTFTNNGTMNTTFNTTTARNAVDEIPPTIGATADGFAQDATGAADYVELPMETRSASANVQSLRGVRWYFCGWAASATANNIGFRAFDGTVETTLLAAVDPNFDASTTAPAWVCRMHKTLAANTVFQWSQAKLDALTARVGFSTSAAVNVGVHSILAEVAMRAAQETQVLEQDGVFIYSALDPDTGNVIYLRLDATAAAGDGWATYTVNAVDVPRTATVGTSDTYVVGAESNAVVSFITGGLI